jgi:hypothetical protein
VRRMPPLRPIPLPLIHSVNFPTWARTPAPAPATKAVALMFRIWSGRCSAGVRDECPA